MDEATPATPDHPRRIAQLIGPRPFRRVGLVTLLLVVGLVIFATISWNRAGRFDWKPTRSASGGTTYLLLGSDSRAFVTSKEDRARFGGADATPGERADVVLALRIDDAGGTRVLSISRDLLVQRGDGLVRLAETFVDGPVGVTKALCSSIGLGVDHVLVMHLNGVRSMVDAVGGVDVSLSTPVRDLDSGLRLPAGQVHLDGNQALAYIASRHLEHRLPSGEWKALPTDTTDRPGRTESVLGLLGEDATGSWARPLTPLRFAWAASDGLDVDAGFGLSDAWRLRDVLGRWSSADRSKLPVTTSGGFLPVDTIADGAGRVLDRFESSRHGGSTCRTPSFPVASRP